MFNPSKDVGESKLTANYLNNSIFIYSYIFRHVDIKQRKKEIAFDHIQCWPSVVDLCANNK